jgi:cytochrome oxidase Cu insertion factor (SCO1/SenC/PrrC family)
MPTPRRPILLGLAAVVIAGTLAAASWALLASRGDRGPASADALGFFGEAPDFSLTERSGRRVTRADLLGKVWIANFIYTQCAETCPLQSARLARLQAEFAGEEALRLVSITVDPERDTPAVLARYAERYRADPVRWLFLTGDKRAIYRLAQEGFRLGVVDPDDQARGRAPGRWVAPTAARASHGSNGLILPSPRLVLVDRQARIRAYHRPDDEESLERLRQNLTLVLRGGR